MIYLDSCALVKLIHAEEHSEELRAALTRSTLPLISSELTKVEVCRALHRLGRRQATRTRTDRLLRTVARLPIAPVVDDAADLAAGSSLPALDALHVATAHSLGSALTTLVSYDRRLLAIATEVGLPTASPGTT